MHPIGQGTGRLKAFNRARGTVSVVQSTPAVFGWRLESLSAVQGAPGQENRCLPRECSTPTPSEWPRHWQAKGICRGKSNCLGGSKRPPGPCPQGRKIVACQGHVTYHTESMQLARALAG